ncbi:glycosyltransferase family 4 protein [Lewinella sp. W8]|uniref:glycosyltransferase family 4 protein n=1 Tax=Lewinella sp. W8 TaxID=2528208 RepID=UPI0010688694|nr:glycosyltransferase family 4 protein [Lewinella sp. W8]MTB49526.1 glycosyltransferase [Lewinella sp. W8]
MSATAPSLLVVSDYRDSLNAVRPEGRWFVGLVRDFGYQVTVMTRTEGANYVDEMRAAGVRIIDWHPSSKFGKADRQRIRRELRENHYDLLHLFNNKSIVAGIMAASNWPGKVVTYRGYTGNVHWWDPSAYTQHLNRRVDMITCVSQAVKDSFDRLPFFDRNKTVVVAKGHDPAWYAEVKALDLNREFDIPDDRTVIVIVANARKMKGMEYLGSAVRKLPPDLGIHFLFAGRGLDTQDLLADFADSYYGHQYTFAGFRTDVLNLVAAADISLLPSVKGEGLSKVLLESMFLGRPTIMTDIGGNRGLGIDGETALIVPPRDEEALRDAIVRLAEDGELRQRIGPAGRDYMTEHYRADVTVKRLHEAYQQLLSR